MFITCNLGDISVTTCKVAVLSDLHIKEDRTTGRSGGLFYSSALLVITVSCCLSSFEK